MNEVNADATCKNCGMYPHEHKQEFCRPSGETGKRGGLKPRSTEGSSPSSDTTCKHESSWFDRTIQQRKDGSEGMANICNDCGEEC